MDTSSIDMDAVRTLDELRDFCKENEGSAWSFQNRVREAPMKMKGEPTLKVDG